MTFHPVPPNGQNPNLFSASLYDNILAKLMTLSSATAVQMLEYRHAKLRYWKSLPSKHKHAFLFHMMLVQSSKPKIGCQIVQLLVNSFSSAQHI